VNGTADKPGGGSWTTFSDARLKKNVKPLEGALDRLMRLQGVTFEYKDPDAIHELHGVQIGMIAQEVEKIFPDWVDTAPNGMKRLSVHGFEALAVEAMRQLRTEEDAKLAEFKAANANLQKETDAKLAGLESANTQIRHENEELQKQLAGEKQTVAQLESRLAILEKQFARVAVAADKEQTTANPPRVVSR
jgi:DNA repair exonuclease SbcCD ATPase subunit